MPLHDASQAGIRSKVAANAGVGVPRGNRTPVAAVKGRCPGPLDDGDGCGCACDGPGAGGAGSGAEPGGARRDRTADLYNAIVALSQLSYGPGKARILRPRRRPVKAGPAARHVRCGVFGADRGSQDVRAGRARGCGGAQSSPRNARSRRSPVLGHRQCTRPFSVYTMQSARSGYGARVMGRAGSWPGIALCSCHDSRGSMRGRTPWRCHSFAFSGPQSSPRSALKSRHRPRPRAASNDAANSSSVSASNTSSRRRSSGSFSTWDQEKSTVSAIAMVRLPTESRYGFS